jgi:glycosyltransferase involved in cell wall biosynthesis
LVIDNVVPQPDRDGGSVITFEFMTILAKLGYRVVFASTAGVELETRSAVNRLLLSGIEVIKPPRYNSISEYLECKGNGIDLIMIFRYNNAMLLKDRLSVLSPSARIIFVPADLHFLREKRRMIVSGSYNAASVEEIWRQELLCIHASDVTILHSDEELKILQRHVNKRKLRLLRWITRTRPSLKGFSSRAGLCFIGGFQHSPNEDGVLWFVHNILPIIRRLVPGICFHIVGSHMTTNVERLASPGIIVHGWVKDLRSILDEMRVCVAPLRYGAGLKGKVVSSLAHGVPVVGTQIALEGTGLGLGDGVLAGEDPERFAQAVVSLYRDEGLWTSMSEAGVRCCKSLYSEELALRVFQDIQKDLQLVR